MRFALFAFWQLAIRFGWGREMDAKRAWDDCKSSGAAISNRIANSSRVAKAMTVLAALSIPVGLIADGFSLFQNAKEEQAAPAAAIPIYAEASSPREGPTVALSVNYMRLFGAVRTTTLMTAIEEGGFVNISDEGGRLLESGTPISGELPQWFANWKYAKIQPLANDLWRSFASIDNGYTKYLKAGIPTSDTEEREQCLDTLIGYPDESFDFDFDCSLETADDRVAFLFLIIENSSARDIGEVRISYANASSSQPKDSEFSWADYDADDVDKLCGMVDISAEKSTVDGVVIETRSLAGFSAGNAYLWPVASYSTDGKDDYSGKLIDTALIPLCISGKNFDIFPIRPPARGDAITVAIPNGWYWQ